MEYKGVTVFEGSKKEVEVLAEKLKNMGNQAADKYLDELLIFKTARSIAKNDLLDCSEIAEEILKEFKSGEIIELTPKEGRWMKGYENGVIDDWVYHQIYTKDNMVFDPWFSEIPVSLSKYLEEINKINPKGLNIKKIDL
ncbi:hypothetical protein SD427_15240 [Chryseobacterium sp. JJR-5R]|uniref:hypothetical protein n=1 Tax=Chryseobacterium sp. JJR-5R TaxID=3093923 RepID=UPI002A748E3E|nr:hypothetical protein [Chryseobacterium sp. JJR-5R]WPO82110.1 hypothetical protein SD427_15240 [Chryseobacterium sp. JJR-5R]